MGKILKQEVSMNSLNEQEDLNIMNDERKNENDTDNLLNEDIFVKNETEKQGNFTENEYENYQNEPRRINDYGTEDPETKSYYLEEVTESRQEVIEQKEEVTEPREEVTESIQEVTLKEVNFFETTKDINKKIISDENNISELLNNTIIPQINSTDNHFISTLTPINKIDYSPNQTNFSNVLIYSCFSVGLLFLICLILVGLKVYKIAKKRRRNIELMEISGNL
ncbi:hypothetical protein TUBRATIS_15980 [Tubulinosema ratisbonensis]|uniref:Uncharacterized protein n=1 Tax=Tubulinosema ratisbonensis TaxID=291195 RepID=A0A437AL78_9MICR|nr:hypothetical protein TUBRATIS_15980 [Tubulinosema ratisbonensis]